MAVYCISKIIDEKGIVKAYILKNGAGEAATIEHDELKRRIQTHRIVDKAIEKGKWIVRYNDGELTRNLYNDTNIITTHKKIINIDYVEKYYSNL